MNSRRFAASFVAVLVLASFAVAAPQRKTGGKAEGGGPAKEMKAGGKPRIFVATSANGNESWTNDITRQSLEEALVNSGRFEVIAGTQRENLLREQGFANSDVVAPTDSVKVGSKKGFDESTVLAYARLAAGLPGVISPTRAPPVSPLWKALANRGVTSCGRMPR